MTALLILLVLCAAAGAIWLLRTGILGSLSIIGGALVLAWLVIPIVGSMLDLQMQTALAESSGAVPPNAIRFRLDLNLIVDGKPVTASAVQQLTLINAGGDGLTGILRVATRFRGEALTLALPGRPMLIVAMTTGTEDGYRTLVLHACGLSDATTPVDELIAKVHAFRGTCPLAGELIPKILAIRDPKNALTIALANPSNLTVSFGEGIEFSSAALSATDEPLTTGIEAVLPWLVLPADYKPEEFKFILRQVSVGFRLGRPDFISRF